MCINAGGDIVTRGQWRIGIRHPEELEQLAAVLEVEDLAVATSGEYEQGAHIIDPRTGHPPTGLLSVTVVGPDLALADAYATAAFAMGADGPGVDRDARRLRRAVHHQRPPGAGDAGVRPPPRRLTRGGRNAGWS